MHRRRLHFIEPSKIGRYHITLIDGYLRALHSGIRSRLDLVFHASASTWANLSPSLRETIIWRRIPVVDGDTRRLITKSVLEFLMVLRLLVFAPRRDTVFVSCVLPTTLLMLELANGLLRRPNLFVVVHGEIEGAFEPSVQGIRSYGFWVLKWLGVRSRRSTLQVVMISDFARDGLLEAFPEKFDPARTHVVPHPIIPVPGPGAEDAGAQSLCFIGYKTPFKGFGAFMRASEAHPDIGFEVIGGGVVEDVRSGETKALTTNDEFLGAVSGCAGAMFPYVSGYRLSLSAAALDAIATGTHMIATARPCFLSLQKTFGSGAVTIYGSDEELDALLRTPGWLASRAAGRHKRLEAVEQSEYGLPAVGDAFERLLSSPAPRSESR